MTTLECPECGDKDVKTTIELEKIPYGRKESVECKTPVRHCNACNFNWIDREGMLAQMAAVKAYEKGKNG